jgi:hypothetical protein
MLGIGSGMALIGLPVGTTEYSTRTWAACPCLWNGTIRDKAGHVEPPQLQLVSCFRTSSLKQSTLVERPMATATATAQPQAGNPDCDYRKFRFPACTGASAELWWCVDCSARICDGCWPEVPGHCKGATARDGQPHEKTDSRRHDRLREILNPPVTEEELERLHAADLETTWFGRLASSRALWRPRE